MTYVALRTPEMHIERVIERAGKGGHSAPPELIREIYAASMKNLPRGLAELDNVTVYDNSIVNAGPSLLLATRARQAIHLIHSPPTWLTQALNGTEFQLDRVRRQLDRQRGMSY